MWTGVIAVVVVLAVVVRFIFLGGEGDDVGVEVKTVSLLFASSSLPSTSSLLLV